MAELPRDLLYGRINYERQLPAGQSRVRFDLTGMQELMRLLSFPHRAYRIVHVAGTKGKGSTATAIARILQASGLKVGLYTSPHLLRLEERYEVDGKSIPESELDASIEKLRPLIASLDRQTASGELSHRITFFELTTALAFEYFRECRVDVAVIEVGLGGRLDSTNVCDPDLSIITNIGFDHMQVLGNTLEKIAVEKSGIIKPGVPLICGETNHEAQQVIAATAEAKQAPLLQRGVDFGAGGRHEERQTGELRQQIDVWINKDSESSTIGSGLMGSDHVDPSSSNSGIVRLNNMETHLLGDHQAENLSLAVVAAAQLIEQGWSISEAHIRQGLADTKLPGRIEVDSLNPRTIYDIAHNEPSMVSLIDTLRMILPTGERTLVLSASRDKDLAGITRHIPAEFDRVIATRFQGNPRAADHRRLAELLVDATAHCERARLRAENVFCAETPEAALSMADQRGREEWTIVAGSTFLVAEVKELRCQEVSKASHDRAPLTTAPTAAQRIDPANESAPTHREANREANRVS